MKCRDQVTVPRIVIGAARRNRIGSRLFGKTGPILRDAKRPVLAVPIPAVAKQSTDNARKAAA